jgi:O-antigen/teichoic acid export membrane protein
LGDLSGKNLFFKNAVVSWTMQILVVIAGFIVPRQIDRTLGPEELGIWDLGWATVRYMAVTGMGVASALNRYVGLYRASNDSYNLMKVATAAYVWQHFVALVVVLISLLVSLSLPYWANISDPEALYRAQVVLFLLGFSLAIKMMFDYAGGIMTGYHLWWMHNSLFAVQDFILALAFLLALFFGGTLYSLAIIVVVVSFLVGLVRVYLIKRHCSEVKINLKEYSNSTSFDLLKFGLKNFVSNLSSLLVFQTAAVLLVAFVNPIALAIFNRSMALVKQLNVLILKVATMFVPMTSSLIGMEQKEEANQMLIKVSFSGMCLTLPPTIVLFIFGDIVVDFWMGGDYTNKLLIQILTIGSIIPLASTGVYTVLAGFNRHGRISLASLWVTILSIVVMIPICHYYGWSVITVAALTAVAWTSGSVFPIPFYLKKDFTISASAFLYSFFVKPILINLPIIAAFFVCRLFYDKAEYWYAALFGLIGSGLSLAVVWFFVIKTFSSKEA